MKLKEPSFSTCTRQRPPSVTETECWPPRVDAAPRNWALKRAMDLALVGASLPLWLPLGGVIALWIRLDSHGPALFRQRRLGQQGHAFTLFKFRSMNTNQESDLGALRNDRDGPAFKMKDDPRITRAGRWLRRFSLDELPQVLNVLRGEMSLIGPRPMLEKELRRLENHDLIRLAVKPGISGPWQVSGRALTPFATWMKLDREYVQHGCLAWDLRLVAETLVAVLRGTGAY